MDKDREMGRIAANAVKRKAAVAYARSMLPYVQAALRDVRRTDRGESLRAIADWLNSRGHRTQKGKAFRAQTVSRLLYQTEEKNREAAEFEFNIATGILRYEGKLARKKPDPADIERLIAERDRAIEEGVELERALRLDNEELV